MSHVVLIISCVDAGRQGDPGVSQFYLSLEDDLMKRFGSERIKTFLERMNVQEEDAVIQSKMFTRQVESAQNVWKEITMTHVKMSYNTMT